MIEYSTTLDLLSFIDPNYKFAQIQKQENYSVGTNKTPETNMYKADQNKKIPRLFAFLDPSGTLRSCSAAVSVKPVMF